MRVNRQKVIDALIEQIKNDILCGDTTVLGELLEFASTENLLHALPEDDWKKYNTMVLVISDESGDIDIIMEDGGYAFIWKNDEGTKLQCHQGRITRAVDEDDTIDDVCLEDSNKTYIFDISDNTPIDEILNKAVNWLCVGSNLNDCQVIKISHNSNFYEEVNSFLKF